MRVRIAVGALFLGLQPALAVPPTISPPVAVTVTSAQVQAAVSGLTGQANGIAGLNGSKQVPSAQLPIASTTQAGVAQFGTAAGTIADGGALASTTSTLTSYMQSAAATFLKLGGDGSGTLVYALGLNGVAETIGRTLAQRAGDVYNFADHGAKGDATSDAAAMVKAIAYATATPGTHIYFPTGTYHFLISTSLPGNAPYQYLLPSETTLEGPDDTSATISFDNDTNNNGGYLFASVTGEKDLTIRHLHFLGTFTANNANFNPTNSGSLFALGGGNNFTFDHNLVEDQTGFGVFISNSTGVKVTSNVFRNIRSDVIAVWGDSNLSVLDNRIEHSIDDCISFHSQNGVDAWLLRRNIDVEDNQCIDTQSITGSGAIYTVVSHNQLISPKGAGLIFGTDGANGSDNQGQNTSVSVIISYNLITNAMNRAMVDNYDQDDECMLFYAGAARKGQYLAPPGEGGVAGLTAPVYPYPEFFAQAESTSVAVGDSRAYVISNNSCVHDFPTFNGSDTRYKDYTAFGQGQILTTTGWVTLSTDESIFRVFGMYFSGGDMRDVLIKDNTFQGLDSALLIQGSGNYYKFEIADNHIIDMSTRGFGLFNSGKTNIYFHDNVLDLDPWWRDSRTATGGWNNEDRIALHV